MYCSKCGTFCDKQKFCPNCGTLILTDNNEQQINNVNNNLNNGTNNNVNSNVNGNVSNNLSNVNNIANNEVAKMINSSNKKYGIIAIVVGVGGIIMFFTIGISLIISLLLSGFGFSMSAKSYNDYRTLSIIGYVSNGILLFAGILVYISALLDII